MMPKQLMSFGGGGGMNFDLYFPGYTKINSRWATNLNVKGKTKEFIEENRRSL